MNTKEQSYSRTSKETWCLNHRSISLQQKTLKN